MWLLDKILEQNIARKDTFEKKKTPAIKINQNIAMERRHGS
jgi:hypothetical protein